MTLHSPHGVAARDITDKINQQLVGWRESLIDLNRGQRLLYFKHLKVGTLEVRVESFESLLGMLQTGPQQLHPGKAEDGSPLPTPTGDGYFCPSATAKGVQSAGTALTNKARDVSTGQGVWPLHLGVGMLHWTDPDTQETAESPLLMIPVEVTRDGVGRPWKVTLREEESQFNPALRLRLRDFDIKLPGDDEIESPLEFFKALTSMVPAEWAVKKRAVLANFSFPKLAMYNDLRENSEAIGDHPLVQLLAVGPDAPHSRDVPFEARPLSSLETYRPVGASMSILDADSSQRQCVAAALDGNSFVMDGPPGTGKSQTIANIIAELIAVGKSVLFVSEKAAALEVVESRLSAAGLGHMILNLHGERTRKEVARHLGEALSPQVSNRSAMSAGQMASLSASVEELTHFAQAMNERRSPLDMSLIDAIGEVDRRLNGIILPALATPVDVWTLDESTLSRISIVATQFADSQASFDELAEPVWVGMSKHPHSRADVNHAAHNARAAAEALTSVKDAALTIEEDFDLEPAASVYELERRLELGSLLRNSRHVPFEWFSDEFDLVAGRIDELLAVHRDRNTRIEYLDRDIGTTWHAADHHSLRNVLSDALEPLDSGQWTSPSALATAAALDEASRNWEQMRPALPVLSDAFEIGGEALTLDVIDQLLALSAMADRPVRPPSSWFNPTRLPAIHDTLESLATVCTHAERAREEAEQYFLESILTEDVVSLQKRFAAHGGSFWSKVGRADKKTLKVHSRNGKASREVVDQLSAAAGWKASAHMLESEILRAETTLGCSPRGDEASIRSYFQAWELARSAVDMAALAIPLDAVATQLAADGATIPTLIAAARAVEGHSQAARAVLTGAGLGGVLQELGGMPLEDAQGEALSGSMTLRQLAGTLDAIQSSLGLHEADHLDAGSARELLSRIETIRSFEERLDTIVDSLGLHSESNIDEYEFAEDLTWVRSVQDALGESPDHDDYEALYRRPRFSPDVVEILQSYHAYVESFLAEFDEDRQSQLKKELTGTPAQCTDLLEQAASEAAHVIPLMDQLTGNREVIDTMGLGPVADFCVQGDMDATTMSDALVGSLLDSWIDQVSMNDHRLDRWRSSERNQLVAKFASLDQQLVESAHSRIIRAYNDRVHGIGQAIGAQVITREAEKKSRHLPIRTLLSRAEDIIPRIKPCMMMSPLTVSHYVPSDMVFDVVVFDEASQVKPEDAVNCIYRGRQLIVAGDQKQLPPTAFFASGDDEDDTDELDDFESVLDLAKAAGITALPLTWHYRSRHESLIAFSNRRFYEGKLFTFPSATFEAHDLGVSFINAQGAYRRGTTRDNPIEAAKVAERVRFFAEEYPDLSIGIVTMSEAQRTAIQDAMERTASKSPAVAALLNSGTGIDDFFVKALENVQGDERDVIIMSMGYGPDEHGKFTMNFGPLNKKGGWRRLNVAITRARRRLEVVASFEHGMLNPGNNETLMHLRQFLNYAQNGPNVLALDSEDSLGGTESVFEEQVLRQIESWGYDVVTQVGVAGYRIDMAVRHPERQGTYAIGIECDGAAYHSAPTARDRDRLRHAVLEGLGWCLHRIWGLNWWRDRETQVNTLRAAIEDAIADTQPIHELAATSAGGSAALDAHVTDFGSDEINASSDQTLDDLDARGEAEDFMPDWAQPYEFTQIDSSAPVVSGAASLNNALVSAVLKESPVSETRLLTIYKESTGASRVSPSTQEWLFGELERDPRFHRDSRSFWHATGRVVDFFRQPTTEGGRSAVVEISDAELRFAVRQLVEADLLIEQESLLEKLVHLSGDSHLTRPARRILENAIEQVRLTGEVFIDDDGFVHWT